MFDMDGVADDTDAVLQIETKSQPRAQTATEEKTESKTSVAQSQLQTITTTSTAEPIGTLKQPDVIDREG